MSQKLILVNGFITPSKRRDSPPENDFNRMQMEHCFSLPKVGVTSPSCSLFASGELMFYRSSRDGLICLGVAFALMCNRCSMLRKTRLHRLSPREPQDSFHKSFIRKPSLSQKRPTAVLQSPPLQRRATLYPWGQIKLNL